LRLNIGGGVYAQPPAAPRGSGIFPSTTKVLVVTLG
jgi:hypothetical protein